MADCCTPSGYDDFFDERGARRDLKRYDSKGLDAMAATMVAYLTDRGIEGASILEIGGGIGTLQVELLKAGAESTVSVDISPRYENVSRRLFARERLSDRTVRKVGDFVAGVSEYDPADAVLMNRVICCYPDMRRLVTSAAGKSRRFLATSFPRQRWGARSFLSLGNLHCRCRRIDFRAFLHSPGEIVDVARVAGFEPAFEAHDFIWQAVVFERVS